MQHFFCNSPITKADKLRSKVPNASRAKRVHALGKRMSRAVALDLFNGISTFKKKINPKHIMDAWEAGDYESLDRFIPWQHLHEELKPAGEKMNSALFAASMIGLSHLPAPAKELRWDLNNPKIRNYVDRKLGNKIADITHETKVHVREVASRAFTESMTPKQVADEIIGRIGLHKRYRQAVRNFEREQLRIHPEPQLQEWRINKVKAYEQRLLKARALAVARTEVRQATNYGQRTIWREAAHQGYISKETARRVWIVDGAPCEYCEPMDGEETTLDAPFIQVGGTDQDGTEIEPGEVHPNCECIEILETG